MRRLVVTLVASLAGGCSCGDVHVRDDAGAGDVGTDAPDAPIVVPSCDELFARVPDETSSPSGDFTCDETTILLARSSLETWARWPATILRSCFRVTAATEASGWRVGDEASADGASFHPWIAGPGGEVTFDSRALSSDGTVVAQELGSLPVRAPQIDGFAERLVFAAARGNVRATATEVNLYGRLHPATDPRVEVSDARDVVWLEPTAGGARLSFARGTEDAIAIDLPGVSADASLLAPDGVAPLEWLVVSGARAIQLRRTEGTSGPLEIDRELSLVGAELATAHTFRSGEILAQVGDEVLRFDRSSGALLGRESDVRALLDHALVRTDGTLERWRGGDVSTLVFDVADVEAAGTLLVLADEVLVGTAALVGARAGWAPHPGPRVVPWSVLAVEGAVHAAHWDGYRELSIVFHMPDGGSVHAFLDASFRGCD